MHTVPRLIMRSAVMLTLGAAFVLSLVPAAHPDPLQPETLLGWWKDDSTEVSYFGFRDLQSMWSISSSSGHCDSLNWRFISSTEDSLVIHAWGDITQSAEAEFVFCNSCSCSSEFELSISALGSLIYRHCIERVAEPPVDCEGVPASSTTWGRIKRLND